MLRKLAGGLALAASVALLTAPGVQAADCPDKADALGVSRTVQIDTTDAPGFGFEHYKFYDFLKKGEVVLTFDDGPLPNRTDKVLDALAAHCTKATFFPVGKLAVGYPELVQRIEREGHTIGNHTWSHVNLVKKKPAEWEAEIEKGFSALKAALRKPTSPFFRYPFLKDSEETIKYFTDRNVAVFSTDMDSLDYKGGSPNSLIARVLRKLKKRGKGIVLFHDMNPTTARAMPQFLDQLVDKGYKIVHLTAKTTVETMPKYDEEILKTFKGRGTMGARPMSSVISTVESEAE